MNNNIHIKTSEYETYFLKSRDLGDFKKRINNVLSEFGLVDYVFSRMSDNENTNPREINTLDASFATNYFEQQLAEHDLLLPQIIQKQEPIYQSSVIEYVKSAPFDLDVNKGMTEISRLGKSYNYFDFLNLPIKSIAGDCNVVLSVTCTGLSSIQFREKISRLSIVNKLIEMCVAIDKTSIKKFPDTFLGASKGKEFTERQASVLSMLANSDLTINEIACKLNITAQTVHNHLSDIRKMLDAKTNYRAIKTAIQHKLIHYD